MTTTVDGYTDVRALLDDHEQRICPECGVERWFHKIYDGHVTGEEWLCQTCGARYEHDLEHPCPECGTRMVWDNGAGKWDCKVESCEGKSVPYDKSELIDRLTGEYEATGMPYGLAGECPRCGDGYGVDGGPDGQVKCRRCEKFYAAQYSDEWFAYAIWLNEPDRIRVTVE